jgi:C-terminal processing protease CtpA/Prc
MKLALLFLCLGLHHALHAQALTNEELAEVLPQLQARFPEQPQLKEKNLSAASLNALLPTLGVSLATDLFRSANAEMVKTELLPDQIAYWRMGTFQTAKSPTLDALLESSLRAQTKGLIVDLRNHETPNDYEGAARVAKNLVPVGTVLFAVQGVQVPQQVFQISEQKILYAQPIIVLINRHTIGAAEALAAALRRSAKAILLGRSTPGLGALFIENKLKTGRYLRLPTATTTLPDGTKLFNQPVQPDLPLYIKDEEEIEALAQIRLGSATTGLNAEIKRKRMSEAALVREENPELDDALAKSAKSKNKTPDPIPDLALKSAVDLLISIQKLYPEP